MENDFNDWITVLAKEYLVRNEFNTNIAENTPVDEVYLEVLDHMFSISRKAVNAFNSSIDSEILSVHMLPGEFLEMFLDIAGRRGGFCLISPQKLVIFFDEDPNIITIIGKSRNTKGKDNASGKTSQLFKITFLKDGKEYEYRDNTGGVVDPYEIVSVLVSWITA